MLAGDAGYYMDKKQKAQIKFDFIIGFFIFTMAVVYIASSVIQSFPRYAVQSADNGMRLDAWRSSDEFMRLSEKDGVINETSLNAFLSCFHYNYNDAASRENYTYVKDLLNVSDSSDIHLNFDTLLFGITDAGDNSVRNGTVIFRGNLYDIAVRNTSSYFDETRTVGGWSNTAVSVGSETYDVFKIDYDGEFVILRKRIIDCGPNVPALAPNSVIRRFSTYGGSVVMAELTYW